MRVDLFEQVDATKVKFFVRKEVPKLREIQKPADHDVAIEFRTGWMGN